VGRHRRTSGPAPAPAGRRAGLALAAALLLVAAAVLAVHWPVLGVQATAMDDEGFVAFNRLVTHPGWESAGRFFAEVRRPSTIRGYYTPLSMTSLMLDYARGGRPDDLRAFHETSLALHVLATLLVVLLLYRLFGSLFAAVAAGLLFGLHPLTVEPVAWVGERKTLLAACLALGTLLAHVEHARTGRARWRVAAVASFALALLAKPTVVALPLLLPLLDIWPLRRLRVGTLLATWPFLLLALASAAVTFVSHRATAAVAPPDWPRWPLQAAYIVSFYLGKIAWPVGLTPAYRPPGEFALANPAVLTGLAVFLAVTVAAVLAWRRTRGPLVGWLFFLVALTPTLGLVRYSWVVASDKYVYFPALGPLLVVAAALAAAWRARRGAARAALLGALALVLVAEARGVRQTLPHWRDSLTHFRYLASTAPDVAVIRNKLGTLLARQGQETEAVHEFRAALALDPGYAFAHYNLGLLLRDRGETGEAIAHLAAAAERLPDHAEVIADLGAALQAAGRLPEAESQYRRALAVAPADAAVRLRLAALLLERPGGAAAAAGELRRVVAARPDWAQAAGMLAWLLATSPDPALRAPAEALARAQRAAELTGGGAADVLDALAAAEAANGRFAEAAVTARRALALAEGAGTAGRAQAIRRRLAGYERGVPYLAR
jgi:tetratricopeptide (TPR) repeat protein